MTELGNLAVVCLEDALKKATFEVNKYLLSLDRGVYTASPTVFNDIAQHPTISEYYRVRWLLQKGVPLHSDKESFTILKSISENHLEFINGVLIIKKEKQ